MTRIVPLSILILSATATQAQQTDTVSPRQAKLILPSGVSSSPDSTIFLGTFRCTAVGVSIQRYTVNLPPFTTIQPALSRVAGVQVTPYSGAPGSWATVRLRGATNVTGSSQPLYVVDGVPAYNADAGPEAWTSFYRFTNPSTYGSRQSTVPFSPMGNPLLDVPVEDIATVEVLKGAAATAEYGAQGGSGVIRINTRRGADGRPASQPVRVRYAGWGGLQQVRRRYDLLDTRQYAELANVAARNDNYPAPYPNLDNLNAVDWQDKAFRVAGMHSHNLSLDGLTAHQTRYYVAADYLRQGGVLPNSRLSRYSLRANVEQQLGRNFSVAAKVAGSQLDQQQPGLESDAGLALTNLLLGRPVLLPSGAYSADPNLTPLSDLERGYFEPRTRRLLAQLQLRYQISPALSVRAYHGREWVELKGRLHQEPYQSPNGGPTYSSEQSAAATGRTVISGAELRFEQTLFDRHALSASLHYQRQKFFRNQRQEASFRYDSPDRPAPAGGESWIRAEHDLDPMHNGTAAVGYTYDGRYELRASMRTDFVRATADYPAEYFWHPGGEVRWHLGREAFLQNQSAISSLTLHAGAGRTRSFFVAGKSEQLDAGLHLGVLHNHLTLEAQVYRRQTKDIPTLLSRQVVNYNGLQTVYYQPLVGLENRGLELTLNGTWNIGELRGLTTVAVAANGNEVTDLQLNNQPLDRLDDLEKGQPVSRFYTFESTGPDNAGQLRYRDRNNDGRLDYGDGAYQGSGLPRHTLNVYQQLTWKRWKLEAQLDGLFGYQIRNNTLISLDYPTGTTNASTRALDYWTPTHQDTSIPRPGSAAQYSLFYLNEQDLESGNHVRLSQLMLNYEVLSKGPRKVSVWVGGQNLFVLGAYRGFDPNVSSGGAAPYFAGQDHSVYPVARVWQLGVRGQF